MSTTLGREPDGTLSPCRAKPENRGKGACPHGEHIEMGDIEGITTMDDVIAYNESVLDKTYGCSVLSRTSENFGYDDIPENITVTSISSTANGKSLSREQLLTGAQQLAENFDPADWSFIKDFCEKYHERMSNNFYHEKFDNAAENLSDYLRSDDDTAVMVRDYLGDGVDIDEFSNVLTYQVGAMTSAQRFRKSGKGNSLSRIVMTNLNNDMTKERYMASVMFFGGRCCYCNTPLRKSPPPQQQASGEHITPITPENPNDVRGGTRYGNMALACMRCNNSRKNQDLHTWVKETQCIPEKQKMASLARIASFRKFALYSEYTPEQNKKINETIDSLSEYDKSCRKPDGSYKPGALEKFGERVKISLYDLKHSL